MKRSYYEDSARERLLGLLDDGSFREILPPTERVVSPHLRQLDTPAAFDDGIIVGGGTLDGNPVLVAAQEGGFMGGAVGEVHGAKLTGLLERALDERPAAVLLLVESGGVRLHEANAGLIAVSEVMRAVLAVRAAGIPVVVFDGGQFGCFGGMGIVSRLCDAVVMSEEGRLGLSGPEVIETTKGESRSSTAATARWSGAPSAASTAICWARQRCWWTTIWPPSGPRRCPCSTARPTSPSRRWRRSTPPWARAWSASATAATRSTSGSVWASPSPSGCRSSTPRHSLPPSATSEPEPWTPRPC